MPSLLDTLISSGVLKKEDAYYLKEESRKTGKSIEALIYEEGLVGENEVAKVKSKIFNVPFKEIPGDMNVQEEVLRQISEEAAKFYKFVPLEKKDEVLEVGILNPDDFEAREALKFIAAKGSFTPQFFIITPAAYEQILRQYKTFGEEVTKTLRELEAETVEEKKTGVLLPLGEMGAERISREAPIIRMVAVIIKHAVEGRASDIHVEPTRENLRVRFRVDGVLYSTISLPLNIASAIVTRIKILSNLRIDESRVPQDGRFHARVGQKEIDFRISTLPTSLGEKVAMRVLDPTAGLKELPDLGLQFDNLEKLQQEIRKPFGMVLISGPTGSGKTTTLYAVLNILNKEQVNIVTLEDPVEYFIDGVNQSQVRPEIGYSFATGLRNVLRQDPNIIMVGEIRDEETASLAIHAALTGHIVLSTIHTNNSVGIIHRLIDLKVPTFLIPSSLILCVAQRLIRKLCPYCKEKVRANSEMEKIILDEVSKLPQSVQKKLKVSSPIYIYQPKGCDKCASQGTKGRVAMFEVLVMTRQLEKIIIEKPIESEIIKESQRQGMITMRQDGIIKAIQGTVSFEEVIQTTEVEE